MDELERIKQLAGVDKLPKETNGRESYVGTAKAISRENTKSNRTDEWFRLWFAKLTSP